VKIIISKYFDNSYKHSLAYGRMLIPVSITSPVGNFIGSVTYDFILALSLQWIKVSSKSKIIVLRSVGGRGIDLTVKGWFNCLQNFIP